MAGLGWPGASRARPRAGGRFYLILGAVALSVAALSLLVPSTPSYDPWAWLVWGREILHLRLHTTGGPSWKPLPVIFTTLFAPLGNAAPDLWLVVARAGALMAIVMCFKVAWRLAASLCRAPDERQVNALLPLLAGAIAAGSLLNAPGVITENALGYSEGLLTALVLIAFERHLDGAPRQAFVAGFFAALDRPEIWLLWVPYGIYLWRRDPGARRLVGISLGLIPLLWFLPELWGSGHLLRGVTRAQTPRSNSAAYARCPFCTELTGHALPSALKRVEVAGLVAMLVAGGRLLWEARLRTHGARRVPRALRGELQLAAVAAVGFSWWLGVALETQAGFSGNDRYLVLGTALVAIAGGAGWAWGASVLGTALASRRRRLGSGARSGLAGAAAIAVFLVIPPWIGERVTSFPSIYHALIYQAHLRQDVTRAVAKAGGRAPVLRCGTVMTEGFQVPMLAWTLDVHTARIESPLASAARPGPAPNVIFQTRATRGTSLLPVVQAWPGVHYRMLERVRTFNVFSTCAARVNHS